MPDAEWVGLISRSLRAGARSLTSRSRNVTGSCSTSSARSAASSAFSGTPRRPSCTYLGLYALQHRGQESAGIAASDGIQIRVSKAMGYVNEAFNDGHPRQAPGHHGGRPRALLDGRREPPGERAADRHRQRPRSARASATTAIWSTPARFGTSSFVQGAIFQTSTDTEVVVHLFARSRASGRRGRHHRRALAGARRVLVRHDDEGSPDRRPRSARVPAARHRPARTTPG